jgi:hypothetical protein
VAARDQYINLRSQSLDIVCESYKVIRIGPSLHNWGDPRAVDRRDAGVIMVHENLIGSVAREKGDTRRGVVRGVIYRPVYRCALEEAIAATSPLYNV